MALRQSVDSPLRTRLSAWGRVRRWGPALVAGLLMGYLIYRADPRRLGSALMGARAAYLGLAMPGYVGYVLLQTVRWRMLLSAQGIRLSFGHALAIYLAGMFFGMVTPGRAGNLVKAAYLKGVTGEPLSRCANSVVLERLLDLVVIFVLACAGGAAYLPLGQTWRMAGAGCCVIALGGLAVLFRNPRVYGWFVRHLPIPVPGAELRARLRDALGRFFEATPRYRDLASPLIVGFVSWAGIYAAGYCVLAALSADVPLPACIVLLPIGTAVGLIPVTVSGWGTRELALAAVLAQFDVSLATVISYSLIAFLLGSLGPAIVGASVVFIIGRLPARSVSDPAGETSGADGPLPDEAQR